MAILTNYLDYFTIGAAVLALVSFLWILILHLRLRKLFSGASGRDVEGVVSGVKRELENLRQEQKNVAEYIAQSEPRLKKSLKHVGMVRFNSFQDLGGQQSFAVALLDEHKDGVVISSLYGREGNRTYAKTIVKGEPQFKLSPEEEEAIKLAMDRQ
ncbi:MAG: DUF4446 family protein [Candidatus Niyogibacteria bacterium]|nr:DUF4446 family protein [Candidatus Niyogibacteria bacterium]